MLSNFTAQQRQALANDGYLVLAQVLDQAQVISLVAQVEELWRSEGEQAGTENYVEPGTRRLANLANKGDIFRSLFAHPTVLEAVAAVIGPEIRLSMLNARDVLPYAGRDQPLHCDTDSGELPLPGYTACTVIWLLDDFIPANGATRLVPGSHLTRQTPKATGIDPFAPHPQALVVTGKAGDVLVFNGHCWHAGGRNQTGASRRAILAHYRRADVPLRDDRRQQLDPVRAARLTPQEQQLLGILEHPRQQRQQQVANFVQQVQGGLIVSCQALPGEPLFGAEIMARLAVAAQQGGGVAIRANTPVDIAAIRKAVDLPIIGLYKADMPGYPVYITPTLDHARQVAAAGAAIIAIDATERPRPQPGSLADFISAIHAATGCPVLADISTYTEGVAAQAAGADLVSTTMSGYTDYSPKQPGPDLELVRQLAGHLSVPLFAEGRYKTPEQVRQALAYGAVAVIVGGAITRPQEITRWFVDALAQK